MKEKMKLRRVLSANLRGMKELHKISEYGKAFYADLWHEDKRNGNYCRYYEQRKKVQKKC